MLQLDLFPQNENAEETIDQDGEIENGESIMHDAEKQDTTGQEENRPASSITGADDNPSPRIDECTNSAENRDVLIIDHGELNPEVEVESKEMEPEKDEPEIMEIHNELSEIEPIDEKPVTPNVQTNEQANGDGNGNEDEDTVTLIETSNVDNFNEVELTHEMSELDNLDELPIDPSDDFSLRDSTKRGKSGSARSERSIKSSTSRKGSGNESKPTSARTLTRPNSSQSARSRVLSAKSRTASATSNRTLTSATTNKSNQSTIEDQSNNEDDENHNAEEVNMKLIRINRLYSPFFLC